MSTKIIIKLGWEVGYPKRFVLITFISFFSVSSFPHPFPISRSGLEAGGSAGFRIINVLEFEILKATEGLQF